MRRFSFPILMAGLLALLLFAPVLRAQHLLSEVAPSGKGAMSEGGFVITNAAGDTLFVASPDHHIRFGASSSPVHIGWDGAGLQSFRNVESGSAIWGQQEHSASLSNGVLGTNYGKGSGVFGISYGGRSGVRGYGTGEGGIGGWFHNNTESLEPALVAEYGGTGQGAAFIARRYAADPNAHIALFGTGMPYSDTEAYSFTVKGNGNLWTKGRLHADSSIYTGANLHARGNIHAEGTITSSGADFAERFAVVGEITAYTPGDVLQISPEADRHLERTWEPYSRRIAGVYATKPGVLLGTLDSAASVPLGVVGVIPTKVTDEGGAIRRGDLLVTSSTPGHAMKGDPDRIGVGMVIGRALQSFDEAGTGMIEVLVNVQ